MYGYNAIYKTYHTYIPYQTKHTEPSCQGPPKSTLSTATLGLPWQDLRIAQTSSLQPNPQWATVSKPISVHKYSLGMYKVAD
ncbi:hypothetical protein ACN38_g6383 [Penicillium nordicum]|uniref:Uncharacterized protein n=1 Tax=Penicillium nordicum TaxID=229535 RepID=A0A0M8P3E8_9EURO|nr:hypothetical protein ACN38_g6383 [Penicillium nordicum]